MLEKLDQELQNLLEENKNCEDYLNKLQDEFSKAQSAHVGIIASIKTLTKLKMGLKEGEKKDDI